MSRETDPQRCPLCGRGNACGLAAPTSASEGCWCFHVPVEPQTLKVLATKVRDRACLCADCLRSLSNEQDA